MLLASETNQSCTYVEAILIGSGFNLTQQPPPPQLLAHLSQEQCRGRCSMKIPIPAVIEIKLTRALYHRCSSNKFDCGYIRSRRGYTGPRRNGGRSTVSPVSRCSQRIICSLPLGITHRYWVACRVLEMWDFSILDFTHHLLHRYSTTYQP